MKTTFIRIPTIKNGYHYVRVEDIYRIGNEEIKDTKVKSKIVLRNETTLYTTITEDEIYELITMV